MKPFWKTSEFWGHVLTTIGTIGAAVGGAISGPVAAIAVAVSQAAYSISRGIVKVGQKVS